MAVCSFKNKVAVITGAGSGIGQALAVLLAEAGCHLAICDVDDAGLAETQKLISGDVRLTTGHVDVSQLEEVEPFAEQAIAEHGQVNLVFNNAGVSVTGLAEHMPLEDFEWLMNINFWGVIYGCRTFLPYLRQVDEAAIINTSSIFGTIAVPTQSAYNASKFAVRGYTYSLRQELKDSHIGVSCVQPGGVKTRIVSKSRYIPADNGSPTKEDMAVNFEAAARLSAPEAAQIILGGVLQNKAQILVGKDARFISWLERFAPLGYMDLITRRVSRD